MWVNIDETADFCKKRQKVVDIIFVIRRFAISRFECVEVQMAPVAMIADADIAHEALRPFKALNGHGERLYTVRGSNDATVAVSLLEIVVITLHIRDVITK